MKHPDVTPYARGLPLAEPEKTTITDHLALCGECRDLVLFATKVRTALQIDAKIARVAKALDMDVDLLKRHMDRGTAIGELIENGILHYLELKASTKATKDGVPAESHSTEAERGKLKSLEFQK
jgi:hypothetical protein